MAAEVVAWNAVNFGSGWFPQLRKRPGLSGARSLAEALADHVAREGAADRRLAGRRRRRHVRLGVRPAAPGPGRRPARRCSPRPGATSGALLLEQYDGSAATLVALGRRVGRRARRDARVACRWPTTSPPTATASTPRGAASTSGPRSPCPTWPGPSTARASAVRGRRSAHRLRRQPRAPRAADGRRAGLRPRPRRPHRRRRPAAARQPRGGRDPGLRASHAVELLAGAPGARRRPASTTSSGSGARAPASRRCPATAAAARGTERVARRSVRDGDRATRPAGGSTPGRWSRSRSATTRRLGVPRVRGGRRRRAAVGHRAAAPRRADDERGRGIVGWTLRRLGTGAATSTACPPPTTRRADPGPPTAGPRAGRPPQRRRRPSTTSSSSPPTSTARPRRWGRGPRGPPHPRGRRRPPCSASSGWARSSSSWSARPSPPARARPRFWGLAFTVADIDATAAHLAGPHRRAQGARSSPAGASPRSAPATRSRCRSRVHVGAPAPPRRARRPHG